MEERIQSGTLLFVPSKNGTYGLGEVTRRDGSVLHIQLVDSGSSFSLDLDDPDLPILRTNPNVVDDMTSLQHLHLPAILFNLRERSLADKPYTFLGGSVLVAVNPLIPAEKSMASTYAKHLGSPSAVNSPHPYAIAERAYQQLLFAARRRSRTDEHTIVNQSILVSGESGAGKTESAKLVLRHLVQRCMIHTGSNTGDNNDMFSVQDLDQRLLESNPILEAFGNAATKRNHNSSRFGKFLKLEFQFVKGKVGRSPVELRGASVQTYLLERSRVTSHSAGERNYHIFYYLTTGTSKSQREAWNLLGLHKYLVPKERVESGRAKLGRSKRDLGARKSQQRLAIADKSNFRGLCDALETIGVPRGADGSPDLVDQEQLFGAVAAVLHLGNINFKNSASGTEGDVAEIFNLEALDYAAELLGVKAKKLKKIITERKVIVAGEEIVTKRNAIAAKDAVDALAKAVYERIFHWLVHAISKSTGAPNIGEEGRSDNKQCFIGVLDIFGFETFTVNDFEQLLINFTNEALQGSFNAQVFEAEAALYEQEGLIASQEEREPPSDNSGCMELLSGVARDSCGAISTRLGVLGIIDAEGRTPQPLDEKLNTALHRAFKGHTYFPTPHPRDLRTTFNIMHYAGPVKYTVGNFLEKNSDRAPPEVDQLFSDSSCAVVGAAFALARNDSNISKVKKSGRISTLGGSSASNGTTIISNFRKQIEALVSTLDATRCSFIRCVKPNPHMLRDETTKFGAWFERRYVSEQLENLSIRQTTQVLKGGLPTRIPYDHFIEAYTPLLPDDALQVWKSIGRSDERSFVKALFFAFDFAPNTYKLGLTRAFFKAGMLTRLQDVLDTASSGEAVDTAIVVRFRTSFTLRIWRVAFAKARAVNLFTRLLEFTRERNSAVTILQRLARKRLLELEAKAEMARLREERRAKEREEAVQMAKEARRRQKELEKKAAEAASRKVRAAEQIRLEEVAAFKRARELEESAEQAEIEEHRVRDYREGLEREEQAMRKLEAEETRRTVERCGGEEAYLLQKKREQEHVKFSQKVRVAKFTQYFGPANIEPKDQSPLQMDENLTLPGEDLVQIARETRIISGTAASAREPPSPGKRGLLGKARDHTAGFGRAAGAVAGAAASKIVTTSASAAAVATGQHNRRSPPSPPRRPALVKDNSGSELLELSTEQVWIAFDLEQCPRDAVGPKFDREQEGTSNGRRQSALSQLACMVKSVGRRGSQLRRRSLHQHSAFPDSSAWRKKHNSDDDIAHTLAMPDANGKKAPLKWRRCFFSLKGFHIVYFSGTVKDRDTGKLIGSNKLGEVALVSVARINRFAEAPEDSRLLASTREQRDIDVKNVLQLIMHTSKGSDSDAAQPDAYLRFESINDCNEWSRALDKILKRWEKEKRTNETVLHEMNELGMTIHTGAETYGESGDAPFVTKPSRQVALFDEEVSDTAGKGIVCEECRTINFLVEREAGGFWCSGCHFELDVRSVPGLVESGQASAEPISLLQPAVQGDFKDPVEELFGLGEWPITVLASEDATLTVFEGEVMGSTRWNARTRTRDYYFSYRCQYNDTENERDVRFWCVDFPYEAFQLLHDTVTGELDSRGLRAVDSVPTFPEDSGDGAVDQTEQARLRLRDLNTYMVKLLQAGQEEAAIMRAAPMREFFNLDPVVYVLPYSLQELERLQTPFRALERQCEFPHENVEEDGQEEPSIRKLSRRILSLYNKIQPHYLRIEASADEEVVFKDDGTALNGLTNQERGEILSLAHEYLIILEKFEGLYLPQIRAFNKRKSQQELQQRQQQHFSS